MRMSIIYKIFSYTVPITKLTPNIVMFKKTFFQVHWFLGITAGLILSLMGVTGAIYSYEQQILKWLNPASYHVTVPATAKLNPDEIYQHFHSTRPEMQINTISIAHDPSEASSINIVKAGARKGQNILINPYSADILPEVKGRDFFQFIQQLHRNLTVGEWGKQITGASTLMLIFFVLSGIYLRWPKKHTLKQWLAIKPKLKGRSFLWDLHAVVGTWVILFYLVLACTGLYWSYDWWRSGMFKVMGVTPPPQESSAKAPNRDKNNPSKNNGAENNGTKNNKAKSDQAQHINTDQVSVALQQSWTGVNAQLGRAYSSMTLSVPKKADGRLEISFVDATPQHERARNKAVFNYQKNTLEDVDLYEDKKLNEKIMSSMLPVHRGSFFGAVVQFMVMLAALCMPLFFITGWMLYLKRRKQKKLTLAAKNGHAILQADPNAKHWLICYASQTGVAEQLAWRTSSSLQEAGHAVQVKSVQQLSRDDLQQATQILFVASTYGTGEAPDLASSFEKKILNPSTLLDLSHLHYAVLALGSKEYPDSYCSFGHRIDQFFKRNQAQALFDLIEVDNGSDADIQQWNHALAQVTQLELLDMNIEKVFDTWQLKQRDLLNPDSLGAPAYNIELQATHDAVWQAGDIAEIQPENSHQAIDAFLATHTISTDPQFNRATLQQQLRNRDLRAGFDTPITAQELLAQLPILPTREYSIASLPTQKCLRLVVRQKSDAAGELGLGSGWLTAHTALEDRIQLRIRNNSSFHLIDDNRPIICIGNGTGIAGLMSLIHARVQAGYTENWLIFGERQRAHDFFYQDTLQTWLETQMLQRLDLAFSRDQAEKYYVHHVLRQHAETLKAWIEQEAVIYVCGSIEGMASGVEQALIDILGETRLDQLRQEGRYRRDVY